MYSGDEYYGDDVTSPTGATYNTTVTYLKCYMCVAPKDRMEEPVPGFWPTRRVIKTHIAGRADPTEVYTLSCGHTII